ncbi:hypothetical protein [Lacticaseibacillus yichunensis]|uniref:Uncharacterized protein n=1 Tax=Lacticaseibacillus yichunensis TaxID=2486015 RepID=A0ABW4CMN3_9LACO|nr:hypothetical protein [Lacticaseibacillus yichunensis]
MTGPDTATLMLATLTLAIGFYSGLTTSRVVHAARRAMLRAVFVLLLAACYLAYWNHGMATDQSSWVIIAGGCCAMCFRYGELVGERAEDKS